MKKMIVLFLCVVVVLSVFVGCSPKSSDKYSTTQSTTPEGTPGKYYIFETQDVHIYLKFLETLDQTKYKIEDISTSLQGHRTYGSDEFYMITYRVLE